MCRFRGRAGRVIPRLCGHRNVGQLLMRLLLRIGKKKTTACLPRLATEGRSTRAGARSARYGTRVCAGVSGGMNRAMKRRARTSLLVPHRPRRFRGIVVAIARTSARLSRVRRGVLFQILEHPGDGGVVEGPRARVEPLLNERDASVLGRHRLRRHELLLLRLHLLQEMDLRG